MNKRNIILYTILFAVVICLPHAFFLMAKNHLDTGNYENRALYEAPVIGQTPYNELTHDFEDYYNDHLPFRNQLIAINNTLNYVLLGATTGDQVLIGKDGWLYIKDVTQGNQLANYAGEGLLSEEELKQIADNMVSNRDFIEGQGREFVIMISPNKSRVYPEYMPDYMGEPAEEYQLKQIIDYLMANTDLRIVYDLDEIMKTKEELYDRQIPVYHKVDTHWNNVGAYAGAKALLSELGKEMPDITTLDISQIPNTEADLGGMMHMTGYFMDTEVNYEVSGYEDNNATIELDDNDNIAVISYRSDAPDQRSLYMYRDSFAKSMGRYIASQFSYLYMRHMNTYTLQDMEAVDPDIFVFETVERGAAYTMSTFDARREAY